jgi:hypothetical protein
VENNLPDTSKWIFKLGELLYVLFSEEKNPVKAEQAKEPAPLIKSEGKAVKIIAEIYFVPLL